MIKALNELFYKRVEHQRIRKYGERSKNGDPRGTDKAGAVFGEEKESYEPIKLNTH